MIVSDIERELVKIQMTYMRRAFSSKLETQNSAHTHAYHKCHLYVFVAIHSSDNHTFEKQTLVHSNYMT